MYSSSEQHRFVLQTMYVVLNVFFNIAAMIFSVFSIIMLIPIMEILFNQDGKVDIRMESVDPEELIRVMENGIPAYEGTFKLASLVRYLKETGNEMINKSSIYTH